MRGLPPLSFLVLVSLPNNVVPIGKTSFVKYPLYDGYVRSCSQKEENFGSEVSRIEKVVCCRGICFQVFSPFTFASGKQDTLEVRRYVPDLTDIKASWLAAGKEYVVEATEGTLYPFDGGDSPAGTGSMSGWCGEDEAGDRVSFLMFDLRDFDRDGLGSVHLRMTPKSFPSISKVQVRGGCKTDWYENSLTWETAPIISDAEHRKVICTWEGNEEIMYYETPLTCDITNVTRAFSRGSTYEDFLTGTPGQMCLTIDMVHGTTNSREPVVFWSRELDERAKRTISVTSIDSFMGNANPARGAALEYGTVAGSTDSYSWKPHLLIEGSGCGKFPEHTAYDIPCDATQSSSA